MNFKHDLGEQLYENTVCVYYMLSFLLYEG